MSEEEMAAQGRRDAADWFVENQSDREPDRTRLLQWEKWSASGENRANYAEVVSMCQHVRRLSASLSATRKELLDDVVDEPDVIVKGVATAAGTTERLFALIRSFSPVGCVLGRVVWVFMVVFATVGALAVLMHSLPLSDHERFYATVPGERRDFALPDGSHITLGGDTSVVVRFAAHARVVDLEKGKAFFKVQHDPSRPFVVHAGGGTTTAVGTSFEVRQYANHVQVRVRDGVVVVSPLKTPESPDVAISAQLYSTPIRVARGEEMSYDSHGKSTKPKPAAPPVTAAWTEGHLAPLIYSGSPLPDVIEDIQSYTQRRIMIDPVVADLRYSGIVKQEDVDAWILDLAAIYPVEVIDCRESSRRSNVPECADPQRIVIRSQLSLRQRDPQSASR